MDAKSLAAAQAQKQRPTVIIEHGRWGDTATVCRGIVETSNVCILVIWLVMLLAFALGYLNLALFLINLGTIVVVLFSIVAISGLHDTYLTKIFVVVDGISCGISIAFAIVTGLSALSCAGSGTLCPPAPDTYLTYTVAAIASLVLGVICLISTIAAFTLMEIYEEADRETKTKRG
jgi:hypothetical protein